VKAAIALGASVGDRARALGVAWSALALMSTGGPPRASRIYATAPVGGVASGGFFNAVVVIDTPLAPLAILEELQRLEARIGRRRARRNADRVIDLDLLLVEGVVSDHPRLLLPHPRMGERSFVLQPLREAWPEAPDPRGGVPWRERPFSPVHPVAGVLPARGPRCRPPASRSLP
jgi:2-amino-4-hydroxy-6-hydroxymethyldihydropteridine diphosphokinase